MLEGEIKKTFTQRLASNTKNDKTSQISSYEHKQFFQKTSLYILAVIMIQ